MTFNPEKLDRGYGWRPNSCRGSSVETAGTIVMAVSMILHGLGNNAVNYGALSMPGGEIHVD